MQTTMTMLFATLVVSSSCDDERPEELPHRLAVGLTMFWRMDEGGNGARADQISGVGLLPWQRTGVGEYSQNGLGTVPTFAKLGHGQHIDGASGYHFSAPHAVAMNHAKGSFTWVGWVSVDADAQHVDDQTMVAKWNGRPDTAAAPVDQREYRVWHDPATLRWHFEVSRNGLEGAGNSLTVTHPAVVQPGMLHFVEAWFDAAKHVIGIRVSTERQRGDAATRSWTEGVFAGLADLNVGAQNTCTDDHLSGVIDAIGYWNRSLTDEESRALWRNGKGLEF